MIRMLTRSGVGARPPRSRTGFTIIELLVALTIAGILTAIAIPAFRGFIATQRIKTASFDMNYSLVLARSEAIKRATNMVIKRKGSCWQDGWEVRVGSATGQILSEQAAYPDLAISTTAGAASSLTYNSEGRLSSASIPFQVGSRTLTSAQKRCVNIDLSGLPSNKYTTCSVATVSCP